MGWITRGAVTSLAFATLVALPLASRWASVDAGQAPREVVLVVRHMAFYADGHFDRPNPTLKFRAGEEVRLVLRNEETGIVHNFAVPGWGLASRDLNGEGTTALDFTVPRERGRGEYICTPHFAMMRGSIEIE